MGVLSKPFGHRNKVDLIKDLAKARVKEHSMASVFGVTPEAIDQLPLVELMGLPEATVVTIAETYSQMKSQGLPDTEILNLIEAHRSMIGSGSMPNPVTLPSYVQYRIKLEYRDVAPISERHIEQSLTEALRFVEQHKPERFGSTDKEHFNAAYRGRLLLSLVTMVLYVLVFVLAIGGIVALFAGEFVRGFGAFALAAGCFGCWYVLHNWVLTHPKSQRL